MYFSFYINYVCSQTHKLFMFSTIKKGKTNVVQFLS
uniref:Uncharacterized protein n=1 Tax=Rhizophora mucronata TaxID=61149 RepID=A0A2P2N1G6_RHIMU